MSSRASTELALLRRLHAAANEQMGSGPCAALEDALAALAEAGHHPPAAPGTAPDRSRNTPTPTPTTYALTYIAAEIYVAVQAETPEQAEEVGAQQLAEIETGLCHVCAGRVEQCDPYLSSCREIPGEP
jgi:hypothetical protein